MGIHDFLDFLQARDEATRVSNDAAIRAQEMHRWVAALTVYGSQVADVRPVSYCEFSPDSKHLITSGWYVFLVQIKSVMLCFGVGSELGLIIPYAHIITLPMNLVWDLSPLFSSAIEVNLAHAVCFLKYDVHYILSLVYFYLPFY